MFFIDHSETADKRVVIVEVNGALNSDTAHGFEDYIDQIVESKKSMIVVDCAKLEFVSSAGLGAFIYSQKKLIADNGFMVICNLSVEISSLFSLIGFGQVFMIAGSRDEAMETMEKRLRLGAGGGRNKSAFDDEYPDDGDLIVRGGSVYPGRDDMIPGQDDTESFDSPIIIECAGCRSVIRIKKAGNYMCPDCKTDFTVDPDETVVF